MGYEYTKGNGETITCDDCSSVVNNWFADDHAICKDCYYLRQEK
jgi:hypothetical protein